MAEQLLKKKFRPSTEEESITGVAHKLIFMRSVIEKILLVGQKQGHIDLKCYNLNFIWPWSIGHS